jgi:peptidoglycan/LPS O-acetylase OafA/YrhL
MGILRIYLALCVIAWHSNGFLFPTGTRINNGLEAVQIFYIISGFYMGMILSTKYDTAKDFYVARFLRLFPTYWLIGGAIVLWSVVSGLLFHRWIALEAFVNPAQNGGVGFWLASLTNFTLFGQDWTLFFRHDLQAQYLVIPPAWSLGVEVTFYAFAPYLNRWKTRSLIALALISTAARIFAYQHLSAPIDPWSFRFFPFEIALFVFGLLSYRLYVAWRKRVGTSLSSPFTGGRYAGGVAVILFGLLIYAEVLTGMCQRMGWQLGSFITFPAWIFMLPVLFMFFRNNPFDRYLGELSYPTYLVHHAVITTLRPLLANGKLEPWLGWISAALSLALALLVYHGFIRRMDRKRDLLAANHAAARALSAKAGDPVALSS